MNYQGKSDERYIWAIKLLKSDICKNQILLASSTIPIKGQFHFKIHKMVMRYNLIVLEIFPLSSSISDRLLQQDSLYHEEFPPTRIL